MNFLILFVIAFLIPLLILCIMNLRDGSGDFIEIFLYFGGGLVCILLEIKFWMTLIVVWVLGIPIEDPSFATVWDRLFAVLVFASIAIGGPALLLGTALFAEGRSSSSTPKEKEKANWQEVLSEMQVIRQVGE